MCAQMVARNETPKVNWKVLNSSLPDDKSSEARNAITNKMVT